jgi:hypothetical protein
MFHYFVYASHLLSSVHDFESLKTNTVSMMLLVVFASADYTS